jgi:hypothetical protein
MKKINELMIGPDFNLWCQGSFDPRQGHFEALPGVILELPGVILPGVMTPGRKIDIGLF